MLYIADSTTLISLSTISQFHLLQEIFEEITITEAVYKEVVTDGNGKPGEDEVTNGIRNGWITVIKVKKPLPHFPKGLHDGERESLAYGMQLQNKRNISILFWMITKHANSLKRITCCILEYSEPCYWPKNWIWS